MTLSEALGSLPKLDRLARLKECFCTTFLTRPAELRDPLAAFGGTPAILAEEMASLGRITERILVIRRSIARACRTVEITIGRQTRTVADWLIWKREVPERRLRALTREQERIRGARRQSGAAPEPIAVIVHRNEQELAGELEELTELLGSLGGRLSLNSATLGIDLTDEAECLTGREAQIEEWLRRAEVAGTEMRSTSELQSLLQRVSAEVRRLATFAAGKLEAIKLCREELGIGLLDAKKVVEELNRRGY